MHSPRTAVVIGRLLAVGFLLCFGTGLYSHYLQDPLPWMVFVTRPVWLYRVTQGLHVATGIALIPLVLAKLWTVYPRLFTWPPARSVLHAVERLSVAVFVSSAVLQLFMGLINTLKWYPWPFSFRTVHFWLAWVVVGSLLLHIAVKLPLIREHWRRAREPVPVPVPASQPGPGSAPASESAPTTETGWSRRGFFTAVAVTTGAVAVTTVGQSFTPLGWAALLAPRQPGVGPQGLPINRTARQAGVGMPVDWRLELHGPRPLTFTLEQLNALPQYEVELPISCVEGWSQSARWGGVRIMDLLDLTGASPDARLRAVSTQTRGSYRTSEMGPEFARDELTLLALRLEGQVLHLDHGYPARIISPARSGVLQTKWVNRLEVLP